MNVLEVVDSRRLTGPNILSNQPGAILDVAIDGEKDRAIHLWRKHLEAMLEAVGWSQAQIHTRLFKGGMSLAFSAPIDCLYAATEVNEFAWKCAAAELQSRELPDFEAACDRLKTEIHTERNPFVMDLKLEAEKRGVMFLSDDDYCSVGMGRGSKTYAVDEPSALSAVPWQDIHDIPLAVVTGTNGKSTTVRLLAAMVRAMGKMPGTSSTDWIRVGDEIIDRGDYSGPGGARQILRQPNVDIAILETARGGMLRRGLGVPRADAAVVTNIAEDHLGEFGVHDLDALAQVKLIVRKLVGPGGRLILNADDPQLVYRAPLLEEPILWFSTKNDVPLLQKHIADNGDACFVENGQMVLHRHGKTDVVAAVEDVPITIRGAAIHNISNALAAISAATCLGLPLEAIRQGLLGFDNDPRVNPGRCNLYTFGNLQVLADFAHNPHGMEAIMAMAKNIQAQRKLIILGQAGDREEEAIRELGRIGWQLKPDHVILKNMEAHLRGRKSGEVPALIQDEMQKHGCPADRIAHAPSEMQAIFDALSWSRDGDLLVLLIHSERERVLNYLGHLVDVGWLPGGPLPEEKA